jgi:hypothetical protein
MDDVCNARRSDRAIALAFALICFVVFNANMRAIRAIDTYASRELPFYILENGTTSIDAILPLVTKGWAQYQTVIADGRNGRLYSLPPVATPLLATPLYVLPTLWLVHIDADPLLHETVGRCMEKLVASLMAALSVGLVYLALTRRCEMGSRQCGIYFASGCGPDLFALATRRDLPRKERHQFLPSPRPCRM